MPLYEYECDTCGHRFEAIQKFSDPPLDRCPKCDGLVRKLQSAPAFQFKGSGWYITDYARKDSGAGESKSDTKPGETKTDVKTETKSATKSDSKAESKAESKSESAAPASDAKT
jgi:putative FmdB family regulatory protein